MLRFIYFKLFNFYKNVFKTGDADLYAYLLTSGLLSFNLMSIQFATGLINNPHADFESYWSLIFIALSLIFVYFRVLFKGRHKSLSAESFPGVLSGTVGSIIVIIYLIGSVTMVVYLAYLLRQYHI